ncbi:MAG: DUF4338 domain-containing protein [Deltaproteobacteria bacterium]|nr:DUF4338 domain-containing protein [Deltaproteobacteria bacterium]
METILTYRGKTITDQDAAFIQTLIDQNPRDSRRRLSVKLCQAWNWRQANGAVRDMVCRGMMLALHRAGYIKLPEKKASPHNPLANRRAPEKITIDQRRIEKKLSAIQPLEFKQVRRSRAEKLFNSLLAQYHYLGYTQPVGEQLKYIVYAQDRPIACLAWSSAARHIGCRDRFIGWNQSLRKTNLHLLAYNSRFLVLPWVRIAHLASHILGRMSRILPNDWQHVYRHPIYYLETFVDKDRFAGTCYKAANWRYLGDTTGRGKDDKTHRANRSIKAVWGYPLEKNFKEHLNARGRA